MSYINSALRKAQKERDDFLCASYGDPADMPQEEGQAARKWTLPIVSLIIAAIIAIVFSISQHVNRRATGVREGADAPAARIAPQKMETADVKHTLPEEGKAAPSPMTTPTAAKTALPSPVTADGAAEKSSAVAAELYEAALAMQRGEHWKEAESLYERVLVREPRHVKALNNLGVVFMRSGRYDEAVELFVKAIALKRDYVDPYYNLACLYSQMRNIKAGLRYLEQALNINGKVREWAKDDADLRNLQALPEFRKLMKL